MRSFIIISALYFSYVSAQAQCFDAGDCILSVRCSTIVYRLPFEIQDTNRLFRAEGNATNLLDSSLGNSSRPCSP